MALTVLSFEPRAGWTGTGGAEGAVPVRGGRPGSRRRSPAGADGRPPVTVGGAGRQARRGERAAKSSAIWSNVVQRTPAWALTWAMSRSSISSTCGRPETSGCTVKVTTA